jgi:squalene cyclase
VVIGLTAALSPDHATRVGHHRREREQDEALLEAIQRGVEFLLRAQQADGGWEEAEFTGGGFPKVFYLRYELYKINFPLLALARVRELVRQTSAVL